MIIIENPLDIKMATKILIMLFSISILFSALQSFDLNPLQMFELTKDDIKFYYYDQTNLYFGKSVNISDPKQVNQTGFSPKKSTFFYFHGLFEEGESLFSSSTPIKFAILRQHDVNLFLIDYGRTTNNILDGVVTEQVETIGKFTGEMIQNLVENNGLDLNRTKFVGASLGAHTAGMTGIALGGKVAEIIGIDPAGVLWSMERTSNRLTNASGQFVQAMHTSGGKLGLFGAMGHADYYVNGGREQPCCIIDPIGQCAHALAVFYYAESIDGPKLLAKKCDNYDDFKAGKCSENEESWLASYELDHNAYGTYYLETNICSLSL